MRRLFFGLLALAVMLTPMSAPSAAADAASGPAWWRISDGAGAILWILGVPDALPFSTQWNQDALRKRLDSARLLVSPVLELSPQDLANNVDPNSRNVPTTPGSQAADFVPSAGGGPPTPSRAMTTWIDRMGGCGASTAGLELQNAGGSVFSGSGGGGCRDIFFDDPLSSRVPPELMRRLNDQLPFMFGNPTTGLLHARTLDVALWMDIWNWPHGERIGNPVTDLAEALAQNRFVPIVSVRPKLLYFPTLVAAFNPPEAVQQTCLAEVLSQTETGQMPALRSAAVAAWARGDVEHALRRSNSVQYCLMGTPKSTTAEDFLKNQAYLYYTALDKAFDEPGQTVGLVEFDPLLMQTGGVLDHYRRLGYDISLTDGMGDEAVN